MKKLIACLFGLFITAPTFAALPQAAINAGYTEVEYIESTGTQYIDTGVAATNAGKPWSWQVKVNFSETPQYMGSNGNIMLMYDSSKGGFMAPGANSSTTGIPYTLNTDLVAEMQLASDLKRSIVINGVTLTGSAASAFSNPIYLMGYAGASTGNLFLSKGKLYYSKIYSNGTLVQDLVPVKKTVNGTDVYGMYNVLDSNPETAFYGNKGTGEFTGGNPVCPNGGTAQTYTSATGTVSQTGTPTPANPITPVFYQQGNMILRAVGDYKDSYDATTGKITRNIGVKVLDGTENWEIVDGTYPYLYSKISGGIIHRSPQTEINTHFPTGTSIGMNNNNQSLYVGTRSSSFSALFFRYDSFYPSTAASIPLLKQWLAEQYAAGTPVTVYYPLVEPVEETWTETTYCPSANTCNNLYNPDENTYGYYINADGVVQPASHSSGAYTGYIPVQPSTTYTLSLVSGYAQNSVRIHNYNESKTWISQAGFDSTGQIGTPFTLTITTASNAKYIRISLFTVHNNIKFEQGSTATEYCAYRGKIKIATTKYNNAAFSGVVTALSNAVDTIKTVVANTINQATAVANLHSGKQTKPTDTCPNGKICLLVEDDNGTPHWYEIIERAPGIVPAGSGYTQVEYLQSSGTQYIDTGIVPEIGDTFDIDYKYTTLPSGTDYQTLMSAGTGNYQLILLGANNIGTGSTSPINGFYYKYFATGGASAFKTTPSVNEWYNITINSNGTATSNGQTSTSTPEQELDGADTSLYLFIRRNGAAPFYGAIRKFQMSRNGVMVRDFVPARRNSDGVLGMYDTVSGNFFTNAGTGEFTTPGYLPASYTQLTYLQSDGTQYIDTGIQDTARLEMRMNLTEYNSDYTLLYGSQKTSSPVVRRTLWGNKNGHTLGASSGSADQTTNANTSEFTTNTWHNVTTVWSTIPSITLDGTEYVANGTSDDAQTGLNDYLFAYNLGGNAMYKIKAKIAYARVYDANNVLVRDLVPAQHGTDVGMYDLANGQFYKDAAGGNFTAGPVAQ